MYITTPHSLIAFLVVLAAIGFSATSVDALPAQKFLNLAINGSLPQGDVNVTTISNHATISSTNGTTNGYNASGLNLAQVIMTEANGFVLLWALLSFFSSNEIKSNG
ncbi:hypothetical protein BC828DRAFT_379905 [Blastocladiella britannica]|nr:hypothetical protein BC828DRAFT_379905 [Blastocladiella britannica]